MNFDLIHEIEDHIAGIKSDLTFSESLTDWEKDELSGQLKELENDLDEAMS